MACSIDMKRCCVGEKSKMLNFLLGAAVAVICICLGVVLGKAVDE